MAITLTAAFLGELKKNENRPDVIIEITLDSGVKKFGYAAAGFTDVIPCLKSVSSLQNKLSPKGFASIGEMTFTIVGRDNFKNILKTEYLKNRRVRRMDGFITSGFTYSDYAPTYNGIIKDWSRRGDELTITVSDDLYALNKKIPTELDATADKVYNPISYIGQSPLDIMQDILLNQLPDPIPAGYVNSTDMDTERDTWLSGVLFNRVIYDQVEAMSLLNELQIESNTTLFHDGEKITAKVYGPPTPTTTVEGWTDNENILDGSFAVKSGYKEAFFNRVVFLLDYMETGQDNTTDYQTVVIADDPASQGSGQWDELSVKTIKSKWIKTRQFVQPTNVTGVKILYASTSNAAGSGTLSFTVASNTLTWTSPGDTTGAAVKLDKNGKYTLYSNDTTKFIRILLYDATLLPGGNQSDTIAVTSTAGDTYARFFALKLLSRFRDPVASVAFSLDINNVAYNSTFIRPTDFKDLTTDESADFGEDTWSSERVMLTAVRPDFSTGKVAIEAQETKFYRPYGFIAPAGYPDYPSASAAQRRYGYVGRASDNKVYNGVSYETGKYIW